MRFLILALALASSASAQDLAYAVYASQADLDDGGTLAGALPTCLAAPSVSSFPAQPGLVTFVDRASGAAATYDPAAAPGARTVVVATAEALAAAAGAPVTGCIDADGALLGPPGASIRVTYLALATGAGSVVLRLDPDGTLTRLTDPASATDAGRGVTGLVYGFIPRSGQPDIPVVYLARSRTAGAPESGLYTLGPAAAGQTPTALALAPGADLRSIRFGRGFDGLRLVSSSAGEGELSNVLLGFDGSSLVVAVRPCDGATPCTGALSDTVTDYVGMGDFLGPYGLVFERGADDQVFVDYPPFGRGPTLFTETGLIAATGIAGFEPAGESGYLAVVWRPIAPGRSTLLLAGSDENGATPGIYGAGLLLPVAGEEGPAAAAEARLVAYPNPTSGMVTLRGGAIDPSGLATVEVYDTLGRRVRSVALGAEATLDLTGLPAGVYVVCAGSQVARVVVR